MAMYLFIYTLIGFCFTYLLVPSEPSLFRKHFYPKAIGFILVWPIAVIAYLVILASL